MKLRLLLSLISVLLLSAGWMGISGVGLLAALVPLLAISAKYGPGRRELWRTFGWTALVFGVWSAITTGWLVHYRVPARLLAPILSVIITIVLFGGIFLLYHYASKRAPKLIAYAILISGWIALEYLFTVGEISFPWLTLGNGLAGDIKVIQWYEITGVFGGSLWILLTNILLFEALQCPRDKIKWVAAALFVAVPIAASLTRYYTYREAGEKVTVTVLQPNLEPYLVKNIMPQDEQNKLMLSLASDSPLDVDFIINCETAIPKILEENTIEHNPVVNEYREWLRENRPGAQVITGASTEYIYENGEEPSVTAQYYHPLDMTYDRHNAAMTIDTTRRIQFRHKSILVAGVERMPYQKFVNRYFIDLAYKLGGIIGAYGIDPAPRIFTSPSGVRSGAPICWEAIFGYYCGEMTHAGAQVLFVLSNDGWWKDTRGHKQLFLYSRLRAVETRRGIARSANTGISGVFNQRGDVVRKTEWDERTAITGEVTLNDHVTFYARHGDYIARLSKYVLILSLICYAVCRFNKRKESKTD